MLNRTKFLYGSRTLSQNIGGQLSAIVTPGVQLQSDQFTVLIGGNTQGNRHDPTNNSFLHAIVNSFQGAISGHSSNYFVQSRNEGVQTHQPSNYPTGYRSDANVQNEALSRLYNQIRSEIDLSVSIAERGQTISMLKKATKVVSYIRSFHPKRWGDKWLEYQYGWRPLIQDVYNSATQLKNGVQKKTRTIASAKTTKVSKETRGFAPSGSLVKETLLYNISQRTRYDVKWDIKPSVIASIGDWSSLNPASIAWELTPYSFVIDWFIDIGGYLRNLETALLYGMAFKSGYVTHGSLVSGIHNVDGSYLNADGSGGHYNISASTRESWKDRQVLLSIPFPRVPRFKADLGVERLLSAASLLSQHLGKKNSRLK
jgi:hypothetical protein